MTREQVIGLNTVAIKSSVRDFRSSCFLTRTALSVANAQLSRTARRLLYETVCVITASNSAYSGRNKKCNPAVVCSCKQAALTGVLCQHNSSAERYPSTSSFQAGVCQNTAACLPSKQFCKQGFRQGTAAFYHKPCHCTSCPHFQEDSLCSREV